MQALHETHLLQLDRLFLDIHFLHELNLPIQSKRERPNWGLICLHPICNRQGGYRRSVPSIMLVMCLPICSTQPCILGGHLSVRRVADPSSGGKTDPGLIHDNYGSDLMKVPFIFLLSELLKSIKNCDIGTYNLTT